MSTVPYIFAGQTGPIPLVQLDVNFANVKTFVYTAGYVTANAQANITSVGTLTSVSVSGNITGGNQLSVTGNITGNNQLSVTGNIITNNNVLIAGLVSATGNITGGRFTNGNITLFGANIVSAGPTLYIDPNGSGGTDGNVIITGNLTVQGTTTTINSNTVTTNDLQINMANNAATPSAANNGGIGVGPIGAEYATLLFNDAATSWYSSIPLSVVGTIQANGSITGGNLSAGSGTISTTGNITGGNISITGTTILAGLATAPTAANGTSNTQIATTAFVKYNGFPSGGIIMWSGSIASIPSGWFLCNGSNSTPDLRDRFIVGAGSTYAVANTGGSANSVVVSHTHTATVTDPGHTHTLTNLALYNDTVGGGPNGILTRTNSNNTTASATTGITVANSTTGVSGTDANLPPYYALAYIMKA